MLFEIFIFIVIILLLFTPSTVKRNTPRNRSYRNSHQTPQRPSHANPSKTLRKGTKVIDLKTGSELEIIDSTKNDELYILTNENGEKIFREKHEIETLN